MILQLLTQAGLVTLVSLFLPLVPMGMGIAYAIKPTEQRLALMRPLSLAGIFAAIGSSVLGVANVFQSMGMQATPAFTAAVASGLSEALVALFVGLGCLTIGWLAVAVGMRRHP